MSVNTTVRYQPLLETWHKHKYVRLPARYAVTMIGPTEGYTFFIHAYMTVAATQKHLAEVQELLER